LDGGHVVAVDLIASRRVRIGEVLIGGQPGVHGSLINSGALRSDSPGRATYEGFDRPLLFRT